MEIDDTTPRASLSAASPLQPVSHNPQRDPQFGSVRESSAHTHSRDSSVHDKINQFNTLAFQSKQLERKTADAALKRAMLAREQAENEMRQYRDEVRLLRRHIDEGKSREQKVGERLETVMENYARAKETHAHTQTLWEKEIRRARKETFKSQSTLVKLQEELKTSRAAQKTAEEAISTEKARSAAREQEAFTARYNLVGIQEQLEQALERVQVLEQERDAFRSLAKSEEDVVRIATEGLLPLPSQLTPDDDEFASPRKRRRSSTGLTDIRSSAANESEIEELSRLWQWEHHRAERALAHVDFLQAECRLERCPCVAKVQARMRTPQSTRRKRMSLVKIADAGDLVFLKDSHRASLSADVTPISPSRSKTDMLKEFHEAQSPVETTSTETTPVKTLYRTLSQEDVAVPKVESAEVSAPAEPIEAPATTVETAATTEPAESTSEDSVMSDAEPEPEQDRSRTPSVEPPSFAIPRASLLSLLDAPRDPKHPLIEIPVAALPPPNNAAPPRRLDTATLTIKTEDIITRPHSAVFPSAEADLQDEDTARPHTSAAFYSVETTTVKVNMDSPQKPNLSARLMSLQRTPSQTERETPSFDVTNPALTPTMTREQALEQIRERRGRARSIAQGAATPKKPVFAGRSASTQRRDVSAPTTRVTAPMSAARRVRS